MTWRTDMLDAMPLGVEMTAPQIAEKMCPDMKDWERRNVISRIYGALIKEESYHTVRRVGKIKVGGREMILWTKV